MNEASYSGSVERLAQAVADQRERNAVARTPDVASGHSRLILRVALILLAASLVNGFLIHFLPLQRQVLSAHLVGLIGSALLIGLGLLWPRLKLTPRVSKAGMLLAVYGFCGGWLVNFLGALTGVFGRFPLSMGPPNGAHPADALVSAALLSVALAQFALCAIVFSGLRADDARTRRPNGS